MTDINRTTITLSQSRLSISFIQTEPESISRLRRWLLFYIVRYVTFTLLLVDRVYIYNSPALRLGLINVSCPVGVG